MADSSESHFGTMFTKPLESSVATFLNYLRVGDWLQLEFRLWRDGLDRIYDARNNELAEWLYWRDLLGLDGNNPTLHQGNVVKLISFHITDWVPLLPGTWWTPKAHALRTQPANYISLYEESETPVFALDPDGKVVRMAGGYGNFRFKSSTVTPERFSLFCATSSGDSWRGIPILLSDEITRMLLDKRSQNPTRGIQIHELTAQVFPMPFKLRERLPKSITVPRRGKIILNSLEGPEYILVARSPAHASFTPCDPKVRAIMWAMYESDRGPSFTYHVFEEVDESSLKWARTFVKGYASHFGAKRILGDCDELYPLNEVMQNESLDHRQGREHQENLERIREGKATAQQIYDQPGARRLFYRAIIESSQKLPKIEFPIKDLKADTLDYDKVVGLLESWASFDRADGIRIGDAYAAPDEFGMA